MLPVLFSTRTPSKVSPHVSRPARGESNRGVSAAPHPMLQQQEPFTMLSIPRICSSLSPLPGQGVQRGQVVVWWYLGPPEGGGGAEAADCSLL